MLTESSVDKYLTGVLEFPSWKASFRKDKLELLGEIVRRSTYFTYFQNISMSCKEAEEQRTLTLEETLEAGLSGVGGVCVNHNVFVTFLLRHVGFNSDMISGKFGDSERDTHAMCLVKFSEDEVYLIDIACALPFEEPIPLHKLPYSNVSAGFRYEYRYCKETNEYSRWQLDGTFFKGKFDDPMKEKRRYTFTLEPRGFTHFQHGPGLIEIFSDRSKSMFLQCPFMFRCIGPHPNEKKDSDDGREYVLIWGSSFVRYTKSTRDSVEYSKYEELIPHIKKYFPLVKESDLMKSITNFTKAREQVMMGSENER